MPLLTPSAPYFTVARMEPPTRKCTCCCCSIHSNKGEDNHSNNNGDNNNNNAGCGCSWGRPIPLTARSYRSSWRARDNNNNNNNDGDDDANNEQRNMKQYLEHQLSRRGWCIVELDVNPIGPTTTTTPSSDNNDEEPEDDSDHNTNTAAAAAAALTLLAHHAEWKDWQDQILFPGAAAAAAADDDDENNTDTSSCMNSVLQWIPSESGDPHNPTVEAKQSWQLQRRHSTTTTTTTTTTMSVRSSSRSDGAVVANQGTPTDASRSAQQQAERLMNLWLQILHHVLVTIVRALELPDRVLYMEENNLNIDNDDNNNNNNNDTEDPASSSSSAPLDLLRLFRYNAIADATTTTNTTTTKPLGSSPHTDWGSWTVVWSDDLGGGAGDCLQTYCHACRQWNPVSVVPIHNNHNNIYFVVHVGDATSLALKRAILRRQQQQQQQPEANPNSSSSSTTANEVVNDSGSAGCGCGFSTTTTLECWPSPRHRVVSPTMGVRHSLVYFAYPPPDSTLQEVTEQLEQWCDRQQQQQQQIVQQQQQDGSIGVVMDHWTHILHSPGGGGGIPYADYSLLQDQSPPASHDTNSDGRCTTTTTTTTTTFSPIRMDDAERRSCEAMAHRPWHQVFHDKWNQVQRGSVGT